MFMTLSQNICSPENDPVEKRIDVDPQTEVNYLRFLLLIFTLLLEIKDKYNPNSRFLYNLLLLHISFLKKFTLIIIIFYFIKPTQSMKAKKTKLDDKSERKSDLLGNAEVEDLTEVLLAESEFVHFSEDTKNDDSETRKRKIDEKSPTNIPEESSVAGDVVEDDQLRRRKRPWRQVGIIYGFSL